MYNAFIATRLRRNKNVGDSPATAGASKVATVTARSKSELKELGERMRWSARKLTMADINAMSSQELLWHEAFNENYQRALELPAKLAEQWKAHRFWNDTASPEEYKTLLNEFKKFLDHYSQYRTTTTHYDENNDVLFAWLQDRHMAPIYANLVLAFEANALAGKLWLNPSAISAGKESEVFGTHHHNFHLLIQPQRRNADDGLSADEYFEKNKNVLADKRTPPLVVARQERAAATAAHFANAETNTAKSGSTNVIDFPQVQRGVPPQPDKVSFRRKIQNMTSEEIRRECEIDPSFKDALDQLQWK